MDLTALDNPIVLSTLFYPRPARPGGSLLANTYDGTLPVGDDVVLGYRLYAHQPDTPVLLYFHGNGEIASDHDFFADEYRRIGLSLLVVDYRGYGWSTGTPKVSTLLSDVEDIMTALPDLLRRVGLTDQTLLVMGRSLGSAPAIHAAYTYPDRCKGLIIESGFSRAVRLLGRLGLPKIITDRLADPVGNDRKMAEIDLPLLVIHGERDMLLPVTNGQELYDASPATYKRILRVQGAGHNDLLMFGMRRYFEAIAELVQHVTAAPHEGDV
ncbi:MAG: alpha/beta hydrolase [Anaerolineae bacterium]|nr:alpha/beta hydrolase [Anaerolineae bacterium]